MQVAFITALQATMTKLTADLATSSPLPMWDNEHGDNNSKQSLQWVQAKSCVPNYSVCCCYNKTIIIKPKWHGAVHDSIQKVKGRSKTGQFLEGIWMTSGGQPNLATNPALCSSHTQRGSSAAVRETTFWKLSEERCGWERTVCLFKHWGQPHAHILESVHAKTENISGKAKINTLILHYIL